MKIRLIRTAGVLFLPVFLLLSTSQLALGQPQGGGSDDAAGCAGCGTCCGGWVLMMAVPFLLGLAAMGAMIGGMWKSFEKVGEPGWAAIVPVYNYMILAKIAGRGENYGLLCLIPCAAPCS